MARRNPARGRRERRGAAAVEFVLTLPVYVLLLLGTVEYGNFLTTLAMVYQVTGDACRYGSAAQTVPLAINRAEVAASELMQDIGFPCDVADPRCSIRAQQVQVDGVDYIQLTVSVDYNQLTNAVPVGDSGLALVLPDRLNAVVTYPHTGF